MRPKRPDKVSRCRAFLRPAGWLAGLRARSVSVEPSIEREHWVLYISMVALVARFPPCNLLIRCFAHVGMRWVSVCSRHIAHLVKRRRLAHDICCEIHVIRVKNNPPCAGSIYIFFLLTRVIVAGGRSPFRPSCSLSSLVKPSPLFREGVFIAL